MFYVYILKSFKDNGFYVGMTSNLKTRIEYHNAGRVRSTKARRPWEIVYSEEFDTRIQARAREVYFKSYQGSREKLEILEKLGKR